MPIGIFLFALKTDFQKSEENVEKRRKPETISGFSVWHLFCQDALEAPPGISKCHRHFECSEPDPATWRFQIWVEKREKAVCPPQYRNAVPI